MWHRYRLIAMAVSLKLESITSQISKGRWDAPSRAFITVCKSRNKRLDFLAASPRELEHLSFT